MFRMMIFSYFAYHSFLSTSKLTQSLNKTKTGLKAKDFLKTQLWNIYMKAFTHQRHALHDTNFPQIILRLNIAWKNEGKVVKEEELRSGFMVYNCNCGESEREGVRYPKKSKDTVFRLWYDLHSSLDLIFLSCTLCISSWSFFVSIFEKTLRETLSSFGIWFLFVMK